MVLDVIGWMDGGLWGATGVSPRRNDVLLSPCVESSAAAKGPWGRGQLRWGSGRGGRSRPHSVGSPPSLHLSKQPCRGQRDCWVIEPTESPCQARRLKIHHAAVSGRRTLRTLATAVTFPPLPCNRPASHHGTGGQIFLFLFPFIFFFFLLFLLYFPLLLFSFLFFLFLFPFIFLLNLLLCFLLLKCSVKKKQKKNKTGLFDKAAVNVSKQLISTGTLSMFSLSRTCASIRGAERGGGGVERWCAQGLFKYSNEERRSFERGKVIDLSCNHFLLFDMQTSPV